MPRTFLRYASGKASWGTVKTTMAVAAVSVRVIQYQRAWFERRWLVSFSGGGVWGCLRWIFSVCCSCSIRSSISCLDVEDSACTSSISC